MLADELLTVLRSHLGGADVAFAAPPARLGGGFFTENYAFRLVGGGPAWNAPLVVRLFPRSAAPQSARREAAVQRVLAAQGYPAPRVVLDGGDARLVDRPFFIMERLPGRALMGGLDLGSLARSAWQVPTRLPQVTAALQVQLHRLDASPLGAALSDLPIGVERWFQSIDEAVSRGADGLAEGLRWLIDNQPATGERAVVCHGDLWGGNILVEGRRVTGVIDWTVATIAEPALDVGFTAMSLSLAPIDAAIPVQRTAARLGRWLSRRYVRSYRRSSDANLTSVPYFEALRCAVELTQVASHRLATATGTPNDVPRPTWDAISDRMVVYFHERTGITLTVPETVEPT